MKANKKTIRNLSRADDAVSPVIAVILMVAITVVLAATVYVWVSGFSEQGEQAPSASFKVTNCDTSTDTVTVKLLSGGPLTLNDVKANIFAGSGSGYSEGTSMGGEDPVATTGSWSVGDTQQITTSGTSSNIASGGSYSLDIVHKPTANIVSSIQFNC